MQLGYTILYVPDVPATPMRPVEVMPWGQTIAYVADINGFFGGAVHAHGLSNAAMVVMQFR